MRTRRPSEASLSFASIPILEWIMSLFHADPWQRERDEDA